MQKRWHYVYVIFYPELDYSFYYGSRISYAHPNDDLNYFGSSVTFARYADPAHPEYQADALKVVLHSFFGKPTKRNSKKIADYESKLIKIALESNYIRLGFCLNRNIGGRVYGTEAEQRAWRSKGGKISGGKNAALLRKKFSKSYVFVREDGKPVYVRGLRAFALRHGLNPSHLSAVYSGKRNSHKGWRRYA